MQLIEDLERRLAREQSLFQAQLLREDIARLRRLWDMAAVLERSEFLDKGMRVGWTPGDGRTAELREPLEALLDAVYRKDDPGIRGSWQALHKARMERLLGCLSAPPPKPAD